MFTPSRIVFLPVATLAAAPSAQAMVYLSVAQAQELMFPGQTLMPAPLPLSPEDTAAVQRETGTRYFAGALRAWKGADGYFFTDAVIGKHDLISYAVALTLEGKVRQVEILEYREAYGGEVRNAAWRSQFIGRAHGDPVQLGRDIRNISGATLSCQHVTDGIRRLLAVYAIAIGKR